MTDTLVERIVARLNGFVQCGCCDEEWPQLRHDTVHLIDAQASRIAELEGRDDALKEIGNIVAHWLRYTRESHARSGMTANQDTHIMPPLWPSYGQLCNWLDYLNPENADEARKALSDSTAKESR